MAYMAAQRPGKLCGTREVSESEGIPSPFLGKILLQLRRGRLLRSHKGIAGGYALALAPEKINLLMIIQCLAGEDLLNRCILDNDECGTGDVCPLHHPYCALRDQMRRFLEGSTVADLARTHKSRRA
jgi:Rrf2 family protein